ncbi:unnamed protein product [Soboliphyme baturini]|uniref:XK-related protein n=1 Tax=Soboliphyme baturini TaxID=241478 RepID=A0A183IN23_9BILA|nr:unnamed protein product [Soboliphyme baturini]
MHQYSTINQGTTTDQQTVKSAEAEDIAGSCKRKFISTIEDALDRCTKTGKQLTKKKDEYFKHLKPHRLRKAIAHRLHCFKSTVQDTSTVSFYGKLVEGLVDDYLWVALCILTQEIMAFFTRIVLSSLMALLFERLAIFLVTFFVWPVFVWCRIDQMQDRSVHRRKFAVFNGSVMMGIFTGFLFSDLYLDIPSPPVFLLPFSIAMVMLFGHSILPRARLITILMLLALAESIWFLYGLVWGLSLSYLTWMVMLGIAAVIDLQMVLKLKENHIQSHILQQWCTVVLFTVVDSLCYYLMATG